MRCSIESILFDCFQLVFANSWSVQPIRVDSVNLQYVNIGFGCLSIRFGIRVQYIEIHCWIESLFQLIAWMIFFQILLFFFLLLFQQLKHIDFSFTILVMAFFTGILNLFVYCYYGKQATESFEEMGNCLFESNWYELPVNFQKNVRFMIQNMQKPIYYHGFGMAILNLTTFTKVMSNCWFSDSFSDFNTFNIYPLICSISKRSSLAIWCSKLWHPNEETFYEVKYQTETWDFMERSGQDAWHTIAMHNFFSSLFWTFSVRINLLLYISMTCKNAREMRNKYFSALWLVRINSKRYERSIDLIKNLHQEDALFGFSLRFSFSMVSHHDAVLHPICGHSLCVSQTKMKHERSCGIQCGNVGEEKLQ